jgi:hypothetical protein
VGRDRFGDKAQTKRKIVGRFEGPRHLTCELKYRGESGVEPQIFKNAELLVSYRHQTRELAVQWATGENCSAKSTPSGTMSRRSSADTAPFRTSPPTSRRFVVGCMLAQESRLPWMGETPRVVLH